MYQFYSYKYHGYAVLITFLVAIGYIRGQNCWETGCELCFDQSSCTSNPDCKWFGIACVNDSNKIFSLSPHTCNSETIYGVMNWRSQSDSFNQFSLVDGSTLKYNAAYFNNSKYQAFQGVAVSLNNQIFTILNSGGISERALATYNISTGKVTVIGILGTYGQPLGFGDITFDCDGNLYGLTGRMNSYNWSNSNGFYPSSIYKINPNTAEIEFLVTLYDENILPPHSGESLTYNWDNGKLYRLTGGAAAVNDSRNIFVSIDIMTGAITKLPMSDPYELWPNIITATTLTYIGNDLFIGYTFMHCAFFSINTDGIILNLIHSNDCQIWGLIPLYNGNNYCKFCPTNSPQPTNEGRIVDFGISTTIKDNNGVSGAGKSENGWYIVIGIFFLVIFIITIFCVCAYYQKRKNISILEGKVVMEVVANETQIKEEIQPAIELNVKQTEDEISIELEGEIIPQQNPEIVENVNKGSISNMNELTVELWLRDTVKLPQYYGMFISYGYESMDILTAITDKNELTEIGITLPGHKTKIFSEIKKLRQKQSTNIVANETPMSDDNTPGI